MAGRGAGDCLLTFGALSGLNLWVALVGKLPIRMGGPPVPRSKSKLTHHWSSSRSALAIGGALENPLLAAREAVHALLAHLVENPIDFGLVPAGLITLPLGTVSHSLLRKVPELPRPHTLGKVE